EQALQRSREALSLAQELSHPLSLAVALFYSAWLYQSYGEVHVAQERAEAEIALCTEQGFAYWLPLGTILRGWALAEQGQGEEGVLQIRQGLTAYWATRSELVQTYCPALLGEACGKAGQAEEGLSVLAKALAAVDKTGERLYEAELYRLKGELVLQSGVRSPQSKLSNPQFPFRFGLDVPLAMQLAAEAEAYFFKAIAIARRQRAKSLELRAVMSLARPW